MNESTVSIHIHRSRMNLVCGFTLIELLAGVAIVAILATVALPAFTDVTLGSKLRTQSTDLVAGALLARSEAIKRNQVVNLCASSNGTSCTDDDWAKGWIVLTAANAVLQSHPAAVTGFKISSTVTTISFQPSGVGATTATLTVCRSTPSVGKEERVLSVSGTGKATVSKTTAGSCP